MHPALPYNEKLYNQAERALKFFTRSWAQGDMTDDERLAVGKAYQKRLEAINLPSPVGDLAALNPHDGYILDVAYEPIATILRLRLRCGDLQVGYFDAFLNFSGVTIQPDHLGMLIEARRPADFEVLYDEVDRNEADTFEYRLLLHPSFEVAFQFKGIVISQQPTGNRRTV